MSEAALKLLPTLKSYSVLIDAMAIMVSRFITTHMPYFHYACSGIVTWHCEHQYYKGMSSKSEVVCMLSRYIPQEEVEENICIPHMNVLPTQTAAWRWPADCRMGDRLLCPTELVLSLSWKGYSRLAYTSGSHWGTSLFWLQAGLICLL